MDRQKYERMIIVNRQYLDGFLNDQEQEYLYPPVEAKKTLIEKVEDWNGY